MSHSIPGPEEELSDLHASILITYNITIVTLGLLGNAFVLYATLSSTEIGMHRITVMLIKHLTISDILCLVFLAVPALAVYVCGECLFGGSINVHCIYTLFARNTLTSVNFKFILVLSVYRLLKCYKPHLFMSVSASAVEWVAVGVYVLAGVETTMTFVTYQGTTFAVAPFGCYVNITGSDRTALITRFAHFGVVVFVPFIGTILTNVLLWVLACRATRKFNLKPLITVSVISGFLVLSWVPLIVYAVRKYVLKVSTDYMVSEEVAFNLMLFSMFSNPIVYTVFSKNLLGFLKGKIRGLLCVKCYGNRVHTITNTTNLSNNSTFQ